MTQRAGGKYGPEIRLLDLQCRLAHEQVSARVPSSLYPTVDDPSEGFRKTGYLSAHLCSCVNVPSQL